jgi:hypothetical protein
VSLCSQYRRSYSSGLSISMKRPLRRRVWDLDSLLVRIRPGEAGALRHTGRPRRGKRRACSGRTSAPASRADWGRAWKRESARRARAAHAAAAGGEPRIAGMGLRPRVGTLAQGDRIALVPKPSETNQRLFVIGIRGSPRVLARLPLPGEDVCRLPGLAPGGCSSYSRAEPPVTRSSRARGSSSSTRSMVASSHIARYPGGRQSS